MFETGTQNVILKDLESNREYSWKWGNLQVNTATYHPKIYLIQIPNDPYTDPYTNSIST